MAETTSGIWRVLSNPIVYETVQYISGAKEIQRHLIETLARPQKGDRVLDIGCGTGEVIKLLPDVEYVGFDHSSEYIESAKVKFGGRGTFICDDVANFDQYESEKFDIVFAFGILHHLSDDCARELFKISIRALKPDSGRVVTADPVFFKNQGWLDRNLTKLDRGLNVRSDEGYLDLARSYFSDVRSEMIFGRLPMPRSGIALRCSVPK